jgi:PAS domain S-box-containing protein
VHEIVIPSMYLLAGVMAYATLNHLAIALTHQRDWAQILFACLSLIAVPFAIFHAQTLQAANMTEFIWALKCNLATALLFFILFPWFIALYSGKLPLIFLAGLSVFIAVLFVINLKQPYSLQYDHIDGIRSLELPWGEKVTRGVGHNGIWAKITIASALVVLGYALYTMGWVYRNSRRGADLALLLSIGLFLLSTIEAILARLSMLNFFEVGPFGILAMVICMSMVITRETQQRMRTSEIRFRALVEQSPFSIQILSPDGHTQSVNPAWEKLWGVKRESLAGYNIRHDKQLIEKGAMPYIEKGFAGEAAEFPPIKYNPADNPEVVGPFRDSWVRAFIYPIKNESGKINDVVLMHEDVTERKLTDDALRESELRFRTLIEQSPIGISLSRDGYTDDVNAVFLQMFGYSDIEEVRGQSVINRIAPQCRAEIEDRIRRRLLGEPTEDTYETTGLRKDGSQFPLYVSAKRVELSDGPLSCAFLIDITERKQAEKFLKESEIRFRTIIEQSPIGMAFGRDGYHVDANAVYLKMFGYDDIAELRGQPLIAQIAPQCRNEVEDRIRRRIEGGLTESGYETIGLRKDGSQFPLFISAKRIVLSDGPLTYAFLIDMTERKTIETELGKTAKLLRELVAKQELSLEEERKSIAREVHDELGQILTSLRFDVSLIRMKFGKGNPELMKTVQNMSELSDRAIHGVRNVAENLRPAALDIGIVSAIEWLCDNFTARTGVPCEIVSPVGTVNLDKDRLVTVFRIVQESLTNVSRHADASRVRIVLSLNQDDLCLEVSDDGRVFNRNNPDKRKSFGLLGMSERALSLGGTLDIASAEGEGTTLSVRIPVSFGVNT